MHISFICLSRFNARMSKQIIVAVSFLKVEHFVTAVLDLIAS